MTDKKKDPALLPLDVPRQIILNTKKHTYAWNLRRVTCADWEKFFTAIVSQTLQTEGQREQVVESDTAMIKLADGVVASVEGYGDLTGIEKWKDALPVQHRAAVGMVLRNVAAEKNPDEPQPCGLIEVRLCATWPAAGQTVMYGGLLHRFKHPTVDQLARFNFEASRVITRGMAPNTVSIYPSRQAVAMKIYDELIESVGGYSINGKAIEGAESICREMDGAHKAAAALQVFQGDDDLRIE